MKFFEKIYTKLLYTNFRIFIFLLVIWLGTCSLSRILFYEFHFEDDHMIEINEDINVSKQDALSAYKKWQAHDLTYRFRPISYAPIIIQSKLFGLNYPWWYVCQCLLGVFTCYFFVHCCILLNYTKGESFLFAFFITAGIQTAVYWHLGYSEAFGLLFLSASLLFMIKACIEKQKKLLNNLFFVLFTLISSLSKESYVLIIPAMIFWMIWFQSKYNHLSFLKSLVKNFISVLILGAAMLTEIFMIKRIGTDKISYAGFDVNFFDPSKIMALINVYWLKNFLFLIPLFIFLSMIFVKETRIRLKKTFIHHWPVLMLALFIVLPQFILYFKTGINERYLIPAILGAAFLNVYLIYYFRRSEKFNTFLKYSLNGIIIFVLLFNVYRLSVRTYLYAEEGKETKKFLSAIVQNSNPATVFVVAGHPIVGWASSLAVYLNSTPVNRQNVFLENMFLHDEFTPTEKNLIKKDMARCFRNKTFDMIKDINKMDGLMVYENLEKQFLNKNNWFHSEEFERLEFGRSSFLGKEAYGKMIFYFKKYN